MLAAVLLVSLSACHPAVTDPKDPNFIVAETKDWKITRAQLNDEIAGFLKERQKTVQDVDPAKMPLLETEVLKNMVIKKLLIAHAATLNLQDVDKEDAATLDKVKSQFPTQADLDAKLKTIGMTLDQLKQQIHEGTVARKTLQKEAFQNIEPSDAEINAFYLQNQDKLAVPEKVRVSRIIILADDKTSAADRAAKKKAIDKAHARVAKGEDFSKVATEVSEDRYSAPKGGDIGYTQRGENEATFDEVAFSTKPGVVSPVFQTTMGYQFLKVTDVHPAGTVPIAQARDRIVPYLRQLKERDAMDAYFKKLLADSGVTFHLKLVDPTQVLGPNQGAAATSGATPPSGAGASSPGAETAPAESSGPPTQQSAPPADASSPPPADMSPPAAAPSTNSGQ
jgi:parvulin-like peptidyl-prolyl isomerase